MPTHCFRNRDMVWHAFKKLTLMVRLGNRDMVWHAFKKLTLMVRLGNPTYHNLQNNYRFHYTT